MNCPVCQFTMQETTTVCDKCGFYIYQEVSSGFLRKQTVKGIIKESYDKQIDEINRFLFDVYTLNLKQEYIPKSAFLPLKQQMQVIYDEFANLKNKNLLSSHLVSLQYDIRNIQKFFSLFDTLDVLIDTHNDAFVEKRLTDEMPYLDQILHEYDKNITLDLEQRKVVLTDEDYMLVIAGAGSGKTTTVAAKVKYLVEKKQIDPKKILVFSFTNYAVNELKERIQKDLNIPDCVITTFHSCGNAIIRKHDDTVNSKIVSDNYFILLNYFREHILQDAQMMKDVVFFFGYYFDFPKTMRSEEEIEKFFKALEKQDFTTLKANVVEDLLTKTTNQKSNKTIQNEVLRSLEEVQIANFLFLNGIEYEYEAVYKYYLKDAKKLYTPDFYIKQDDKEAYIEHFGITESGHSNRYTPNELFKYKQGIEDKKEIHKKHKSTLISTYSSYNDKKELLVHLAEELEKVGFELRKRPEEEVYKMLLLNESNKYILKFVGLLSRFINNFKTKGYTQESFEDLEKTVTDVRTKLFLKVAKSTYLYYQSYLRQKGFVDFQDMINESTRILRQLEADQQILDFDYIIIDEYQDISRQRFNMAFELSKVTKAKFIAVGDDWQAIYAFAGSDISLFTKFKEYFGYAKEMKISRTYRNPQELINIAGGFIQKNHSQIQKSLISSKTIAKPIVIYGYTEDNVKYEQRRKIIESKGEMLNRIVGDILTVNPNHKEILLLGRYGFDGHQICGTSFFEARDAKCRKIRCKDYPEANITFMTAHASKGLTYENTVILNNSFEMYGFPSKLETDPVLQLVTTMDRSYEYAEERRLFYVALTRTKNRVFLLTPIEKPSEFVLELLQDYKTVVNAKGTPFLKMNKKQEEKMRCPKCGYPLLLRKNKAYDMKLFICSNEPEICGFLTNKIAGKSQIHKCPKCNGFMIVKQSKEGNSFFGCTNYKKDGSGCNHTEQIENIE